MCCLLKKTCQGFPWKLYSQLIALPQGNCANRQTFQAITRNCENSNTQCGCLWCCGKTAQKNTKLKISDTDWKQILPHNAVQFHAAPKRGGGIGKSMHKRYFSRGKVDLFLEPNTYQIFTQFSMFAFKGICQASWLDFRLCRSTDIFLTHHSQSSLVKLLELFTH